MNAPFKGQLGLPLRIRVIRTNRQKNRARRRQRHRRIAVQELMTFPSNHPTKIYQLK